MGPDNSFWIDRGVEFPCGGTGLCGGCRIRVLEGNIPVTPEMEEVLTPEELRAGWRLACRADIRGLVRFEVEQWQTPVLTDETPVAVDPRPGFGIAIDVGTTTLAAQLVDLSTGEVLSVRTGLNPQCSYGADVMTRIQHDQRAPGQLTQVLRTEVDRLIDELAEGRPIVETLLSGNTVMHHLYAGLSVAPLAAVPFESNHLEVQQVGATTMLPCLGGFVGSDILAGIIATGMAEREEVTALIDLGTNGEIVVGNKHALACASTAAGPAFEAGRIRMGMRAAPGAIDRVHFESGCPVCRIIGGAAARGICGSGLVDAAAAGAAAGVIQPNGRLANNPWTLAGSVQLWQSDIRELQLAKGAVVAGARMLGAPGATRIRVAGAFGNAVDIASARRIGLLPPHATVDPVGNTALRGTRLLLVQPARRQLIISHVLAITRHVSLAADLNFAEIFAESMTLAPLTD